ncbi:MAG TPA: hypothetical protein VFG04_15600 [Planctomycetaceae bacterium]|jgi:septal ring factor EnvC (AmiA/AmiB activator)|nr:hypothetical protein [Planctomycetaceae bacterium]
MSVKRCAFVSVALMCFVVGCAHQDAAKKELAEAQNEIAKLKAELLRTTNQLHDERAKTDESETKMFAAETSKRKAEAQVVEITAENARLSEQLEVLGKAMRSAKAQLERPPGQ